MTEYQKQDCPLCKRGAEYCFVDSGNRKYFHCPKCTYFQISARAETLLNERYQSRMVDLAKQAAQSPVDSLLVIQMPDTAFRKHSTDGIMASFVLKSELPLQ